MTWKDVYTENAGNGGFDEIIFEPVAARYVRMQGAERGSDYGYSIYEMGIYEARQIAIPQFSLESGTYNGNQMLSIASGTKAVEIRYTTDGTEPTKDSSLYIPQLTLWKNVVIKAKAFKLGMVPSETAEAKYFINGGTEPDVNKDTYDENDPFKPEPEKEIEEEPLAGETAEVEDPHLKSCLSYKKDVYVSSSENDNTSKNLTDGDEGTVWSSAFAENGQNFPDEKRFDQWCYIDLGETVPFNEVTIKWNTINNHYNIQVSDDAQNWKDVYINTKNTSENKTDICSFDTVNARYVKMQGVKIGEAWGYAIRELMVYLSDDEQPLGQNITPMGIVTSPILSDDNPSIELSSFKTYQVDKVILNGMENYTGSVTIKVSEDGQNWTTVVEDEVTASNGVYKFEASYAKYVKAEFSTQDNLSVDELEMEVYTVGSADVAEVDVEYYTPTEAGASTKKDDAEKIIDGKTGPSYGWQAEPADTEAWCYIDLGESKEVNVISIDWQDACADLYDIYLTDIISDYGTPVMEEPVYKGESGKPGIVETILTSPVQARYVVMRQTALTTLSEQYGCHVFEMKAGYRQPILVESISAGPSIATLGIGQTLDAVCIVSPSNADNTNVIWSSDDTSVATVSSKGVIKGKKAGETVITVSSDADPAKKAKILVGVTGPLDASRPKAEKTGDQEITVTWEADDNAIGYNIYRSKSQSSGYQKINSEPLSAPRYIDRGLTKGTYYYKIELIANEEGSVYRNSEQSIQSTGVKIELSGVELALDTSQLEVETGKSATINATITPANITITWKSSDKTVATVRNGIVKGVKEGTTVITATAEDKTASCTVTVLNEGGSTKPEETQNPEPEETKEPELEKPEESEKPEEIQTQKPEKTKAPEVSNTPEPEFQETHTKAPQRTQTPAMTANPTEAPVNSNAPVSEPQNPSVSSPNIPWPIIPVQTSKPTNTNAPAGTLIPDAFSTKAPESVETNAPADVKTPEPEKELSQNKDAKLELLAANHPYGAKVVRLKKKDKLTLYVDIADKDKIDQEISWRSSDSKIVSVNSKGVVKARSKTGTAVITAQSVTDDTKKASIKVEVVAKRIANKVLKLKKANVKLNKKGQQTQIEIKKYTKKTTDLVYYKVTSGKKYVKVSKYGKITCIKKSANKKAKAKVRVKYGKKKKVVTVTVTKR